MNDDVTDHRPLRVHVGWTAEREAVVLRRLQRSRGRRTWPRVAVFSLVAAATAVVVLVALPHAWHSESRVALPAPPPVNSSEPVARVGSVPAPVVTRDPRMREVQFRDGSIAFLASAETRFNVLTAEDREITSELLAGAARFEVSKRPSRLFRVLAGATSVEVLGTTFELERRAERLRVRVLEGRVRVVWASGQRELATDDEGMFPPDVNPEQPTANTARVRPTPSHEHRPRHRHDHVEATESPDRRPNTELPTTPHAAVTAAVPQPIAAPAVESQRDEDQLAAILRRADDARAQGRSVDAARALREATANGAGDPRVPLAEFRLGRLLLEDLSQPRDAAAAFARARALAPNGPLASDALAREVEARAASGDKESAKTLAREYLAHYPNGSHAAWVRRWSGLD